jgi:hypothetical protein
MYTYVHAHIYTYTVVYISQESVFYLKLQSNVINFNNYLQTKTNISELQLFI